MQPLPARAFTLIELLIVVAIIAILAAIAIPNFLQAQTRAKVSTVRSDLRTVALAMEAYLVDYNRYPNDSNNTLGKNGEDGLARLTTPVAYITSLPTDPFQRHISDAQANDVTSNFSRHFSMGSGSDHQGWGSAYGPQGSEPAINSYLIISIGPDGGEDITQADQTLRRKRWPWGSSNPIMLTSYDPTNGTISRGDLYRAGGELNVGRWYLNGRLRGQFPE